MVVAALHAIEPDSDPVSRNVSEYATADSGVLMKVAFFTLGRHRPGLGHDPGQADPNIGRRTRPRGGCGLNGGTGPPETPRSRADTSIPTTSGACHPDVSAGDRFRSPALLPKLGAADSPVSKRALAKTEIFFAVESTRAARVLALVEVVGAKGHVSQAETLLVVGP